ncbi:hypothetical protein B0H13DRAFT_1916632 [Mycena leptocephala]|nr:hypothetical protein B0H13DRAFT_1916632 [Mycena leptocephala]
MWRMKTGEDLKPTLGEIMACAAKKKGDTGTTRLYRILVSESAHLIWRLQNERVINQKDPASHREIHNRWLKQINNRLALDCAMTDDVKYGKKAIKVSLVKGTWRKVLKDERHLSRHWPREVGVLVGIG